MTTAELVAFVAPFYTGKDTMHDLTHVRRVLRAARRIARGRNVDGNALAAAAHFHGLVPERAKSIRAFLRSKGVPRTVALRMLQAALESQKDARPRSVEGQVLHDAHLLEGGEDFFIVKSLVTGSARGQSLLQTLNYMEQRLFGRFRCCLPECEREYRERERRARAFVRRLKASL